MDFLGPCYSSIALLKPGERKIINSPLIIVEHWSLKEFFRNVQLSGERKHKHSNTNNMTQFLTF